jgi:hypothetical protein
VEKVMVNLKALEKSLAKIEAVGDDELEFEANGISVVLRPLTSFEENEVERYSRTAFEDEKGKTIDADALPESERTVLNRIWLDRLRQASLAYAVIEIDGQDLRGVEYIETGESDSNGNPISIEKHAAVLSLVERWGRPVLTQMFAAFGELMDRVNLRASQLVKFDPSEVEEEKERLRKRLRDLEGAKNLKEGPTGGVDVSKDINDVEIHRQQVAAKMREQAGGTESTAKTNQTTERLPSIKKGVQRTRDHLRQQESAAAQAAADGWRNEMSPLFRGLLEPRCRCGSRSNRNNNRNSKSRKTPTRSLILTGATLSLIRRTGMLPTLQRCKGNKRCSGDSRNERSSSRKLVPPQKLKGSVRSCRVVPKSRGRQELLPTTVLVCAMR